MKENNIEDRVTKTPFIKTISDTTYLPRTLENEIQVFYKTWDAFSKANIAIKDWREHFVIEEGSEPTGKYERIAEVDHYQLLKNDSEALLFLKHIAAKQGGDGLVDVWRSPTAKEISNHSKITGYRYRAVVVRFDPV
jgi:hypothetical protein